MSEYYNRRLLGTEFLYPKFRLRFEFKPNFRFMEDEFMLPVTFKGKKMEFTARLLHYGYSSKLEVEIEGTKLIFEPDEERNWRAVMSYEDLIANKKVSKELLEAVGEVIQNVSK